MVLQVLDLFVPVLQVLVRVLGPFLDVLDLLRQGGPASVLRVLCLGHRSPPGVFWIGCHIQCCP
jgi:hypothetical protein